MSEFLSRRALPPLSDRVAAFRVVVVGGPRQSGKTTLLQQLHRQWGGTFQSLDDATTLQVARDDPSGFAGFGATPRIIDEVQRGGDDLLLAIKYLTDQSNDTGQFVLSGSTRFLTVPTLSESLAGRAVFFDLWPLSGAERAQISTDVLAQLFDFESMMEGIGTSSWRREDYIRNFCQGGYPEAVRVGSEDLRSHWFDGYLNTVILRDVAGFADIRHAGVVPQLLKLLAARAGSNVVLADLAQGVGLNQATVRDYLHYLDIVYLTAELPVWWPNLTSRITKTPKVYVTDSGFAASLLGADPNAVITPGHSLAGPLTETFVFSELTRQLTTSAIRGGLHFYRDRAGREIDFIVERRDGTVIGIEVKASQTVKSDAFKHLRWLRDQIPDRFHAGYVLYLGPQPLPFGEQMAALPISALWENISIPGAQAV